MTPLTTKTDLFDHTMPASARITLDSEFLALVATMTPKQLAREWRCAVRHEATARYALAREFRNRSYDLPFSSVEQGIALAKSDAQLARAEELTAFVNASLVSQLLPTSSAPRARRPRFPKKVSSPMAKSSAKSASKTAALANLRTGKTPKMPSDAPPASIEAEEAAAQAAADAEVEEAAARFAPPPPSEPPTVLDEAGPSASSEEAPSGLDLLAAAGLTKPNPVSAREALAAYHKRMREIGPVHTRAFKLRQDLKQLDGLLDDLVRWSKDPVHARTFEQAWREVEQAKSAFLLVATTLESIPQDWRLKTVPAPSKGASGSKTDIVGKVVRIAEKHRPDFKDVLDAEEMDGLTVLALAGKLYACKTTAGSKVFLPRGALLPNDAADDTEGASPAPASAPPSDDI